MNEDKYIMFRNRLEKVFRHVSSLSKKQHVSCYRVYNYDLPEFPFCIEVYDDKIYLAEYKKRFEMADKEHGEWLGNCLKIISEITHVPAEKIHLRHRQKKENRESQYEKLNDSKDFFIVHEQGLKFKVNLKDYLDTGLFLDHRITRNKVRQESENKNVLNLFCYTGSFSVYAADGGAAGITSVDLSKTYLKWAEENFELNGFADKKKYRFIHADAKQYLDKLPESFFDLVVIDPPTFSNSKRMNDILDIQRDHAELLNKTLRVMKKGGTMYFSNNLRNFKLDIDKIEAASIQDITKATTPFDFQKKLFRWCFKIIK
ncbi:MAG: class I SAM-dependent methyltransferase [Bacteroidetes bacterium]|nr:class I SAM-dependent methyltransferase [Bacteroidota bacterium]MBS1974813.1 class I SAM-dependent methyltransferase [Bacteroidota bacterium]